MGTLLTSPILFLENNQENQIYIMRDDLLPFSFGGNKVRKAWLFFEEIANGEYDTVVTYGSGSSNHCRIVANMARSKGLSCHIISADEESESVNRQLVESFGAIIHGCSVEAVSATIDALLDELRQAGSKPYFISGGGHGDIGTRAYDLAYDQIMDFSQKHNVNFDYIFFASGTGTTHAGLICGKKRWKNTQQKIVGISIARKNPRGAQVVEESVVSYTGYTAGSDLIFDDSYICEGYGKFNQEIENTILRMMHEHGVPLDPTYTGKAYCGMEKYLLEHGISQKKILFIHTGGTPLFFDWVK